MNYEGVSSYTPFGRLILSFIYSLRKCPVFQKRVQRYCFFLIWPNFRAKKIRESAFFLNFLVYVPFFLYLCRLIVGYSCARAVGSGGTRAKYERNMNGFRLAKRWLIHSVILRISYVYPTYILRNWWLIVCLSSADFGLTLGWLWADRRQADRGRRKGDRRGGQIETNKHL